ncbi:hypothetical protein GQ649_14105 [Rhodococcus sp. DSM 6344]|nr:hypothetical protein [Rhodococcus erythropolis]
MASSAVISIVARTDRGLRLIPGLTTPSSRVYRDALREAFTPAGSDPAIAEAFDLAANSEEGFPIPLAAIFAPTSPGLATDQIAHELPDLHTDISEMLVTLEQLATDRPMDDITLFVSYE